MLVTAGCGTNLIGGSGAVSARLVQSSAPVTVAPGRSPSAVTIGMSRALFTAAPVVVVAGPDDAEVRRGASTAARLGVPLLLVNGSDSAQLTAVATEISRLHPDRVLATSTSVAHALGSRVDVSVVTDPARLPAVDPARPASAQTVLIRTGGAAGQDATSTAVSASARAAGATVIPVDGTDPRADPKVIRALAAQKPRRVLAAGSWFGPADRLAQRLAVAETGVQLPGGGQVLFPGHRLVALYGHPGTGALGVLGEQDLSASIARAQQLAAQYRPLSTVPVIPTFEIIATVADSVPGTDGNYSAESTVDSLRPWVEQAGKMGLYVVLDLQPGRADLLDQAKRYTPLLELPYVGLALDPEWKLTSTQVPLRQIGGVDASEINSVSAWLSGLAARHELPQKLLVLHQFQLAMIRDEQDLNLDHDNVQTLIHMDGQGTQANKDATWAAVRNAAPAGVPFGWKNFYDEDHPMLTPAQTMAKHPAPLMISYQ